MKRKHVTTVLALTLGIYGVHRFYLGQKLKGILHFSLAMFSGLLFFEEGAPLILLPAIIGLMDAILFMVMPQEEFDNRGMSSLLNEQGWRNLIVTIMRGPSRIFCED